MSLETLVVINNINNLSDARYCAGMGADILGFCLDENAPNYIKPEAANEIIGWLAGVQVAGEFTSLPVEQINEIAEASGLDYVQVNTFYLLDDLAQIQAPIIQRVSINKDTIQTDLLELLQLYQSKVQAFLIVSNDFTAIDETNIKFLSDLAGQFPIYIGFGLTPDSVNEILENVKPAGLALQGGEEIKPGLKNFDELEAIFEAIEE